MVKTDEAGRRKHVKVARGVGRFVHAILLRWIARACEIHAGSIILGADDVADPRLHPADGVGDGQSLLLGAVGLARACGVHYGAERTQIGFGKGKLGALLAAVGVADMNGGAFRRWHGERRIVQCLRAEALMRAAAKAKCQQRRSKQTDPSKDHHRPVASHPGTALQSAHHYRPLERAIADSRPGCGYGLWTTRAPCRVTAAHVAEVRLAANRS